MTSFRVTSRQGGVTNLVPGVNTGATVVTQPFIYGVAQIESIIVNEENKRTPGATGGIVTSTDAAKTAGRAKFRLVDTDTTTKRKNLYEADPLNPYQTIFPLVGEYVLIFKALGRYYYIGPINVDRNITQNSRPLMGDLVTATEKNNVQKRKLTALRGVFKTPDVIKDKVGYDFKEAAVQPLKVFEGDVVFQGRYGNSIRFGSSQMHQSPTKQAPNIVLRAGQSKDSLKVEKSKSSLTIESLDTDASSIYIVSDELLPFTPATKKSSTFLYSMITKPGSFSGAQVLVNSDTLVMNAKNGSLYVFATEGIHMNSLKNGMTFDSEGSITTRTLEDLNLLADKTVLEKTRGDIINVAGRDVSVDAGRNVIIRSNETYLGGFNDFAEPIVMGTKLKLFFLELLKVLMSTQPLTLGPTGVINPAIIARLTLTYAKFLVIPGPLNPRWASDDNFVTKTNEKTDGPGLPPLVKGVQI